MTQHLVPEQGCVTLQSAVEPVTEPPPESSACLNDDEVVLFAEGTLSGSRLARLESHLDSCSTCQHLINAVARALDTVRESSALGGYSSLFTPGSVIANRYRIDRFLARGGMGEVYEAFDQELGERVALKTVVSTACDSPRAERKLKGEVQLARRISHPNVCRIYDLGVHEPSGSRPRVRFLTMEFIDGESLGRRLKAGPLPIAEASAIARQLLAGLAAAHEAGVLHRDFKSDNVMLRREAGAGQEVVITDFGLARVLDPRGPAGISDSAHMVGSPAYMAPEQVMGHELGAETDVFAFGVVFFEMLTGKLPFEGESAIVAAMNRLSQAAQPPSSLCEGLPRRFDEFVLKCLRRERKRRFADARSALAALEALPPSGRLVTRRRWTRPGVVATLIIGAACATALYAEQHAQSARGGAPSEPTTPEPVSTTLAAPSLAPSNPPPNEPTTVSANSGARAVMDALIAIPSAAGSFSNEPASASAEPIANLAARSVPARPRGHAPGHERSKSAPPSASVPAITETPSPAADLPGGTDLPGGADPLPAPAAPVSQFESASALPVVKAPVRIAAPASEPPAHPPPGARAARDRLLNPFEAPQ
jgi:serine/threonine protein kinase